MGKDNSKLVTAIVEEIMLQARGWPAGEAAGGTWRRVDNWFDRLRDEVDEQLAGIILTCDKVTLVEDIVAQLKEWQDAARNAKFKEN